MAIDCFSRDWETEEVHLVFILKRLGCAMYGGS